MEVHLRRWWVVLNWVLGIECVTGRRIIWWECAAMQSMKQRRNRGGGAMPLSAFEFVGEQEFISWW